MNIFVLDTDPTRAAAYHCDTHVVKMILETTQLLCMAQYTAGNEVPGGYKPTHPHHPCTRWVSEATTNYAWAHRLLVALHTEYEQRYGRVHASKRLLVTLAPGAKRGVAQPTEFVYVGDEACRRATVVESYRELYRQKPKTMKVPMRWAHSASPEWL